ncbi:hypothetical protein HMPREF0495_02239 [Levilactobacillus brevis ATCC 14869 = DSM 20054]|uniref:Uncharacterized protein n=1 Tax=Levilactobacillus brevis ATCC 14869 = DSM 20054 TaxID=649758 RepID=U2PB86_LEVBR|nr:hypothetical protein HMPREF0495_02239 [Levilactobacillus brevis ATCC 14869 = DSM 20054]MCT3571253.1 hypothetical protein [Levilactobacillus brevis]MCT3572163.1 hypothetical protein [Levilactobacillus brevis]
MVNFITDSPFLGALINLIKRKNSSRSRAVNYVDNFEKLANNRGFPPVDNLWKTLMVAVIYPHPLTDLLVSYRN